MHDDEAAYLARLAAKHNELIRAVINDVAHPHDFGALWVEFGRRMRELIDDDRALVDILRQRLPPYSGGPLTLYRGESIGRWQERRHGFAWTPDIAIARMFAGGLNCVGSGGVLLKCTFDTTSIISEPNAVSKSIEEHQFTVDPFSAVDVEELEVFPPPVFLRSG